MAALVGLELAAPHLTRLSHLAFPKQSAPVPALSSVSVWFLNLATAVENPPYSLDKTHEFAETKRKQY